MKIKEVKEEEKAVEEVREEKEVEEVGKKLEEEEATSIPRLLQSVNELQSLDGALSEFVRQWNELQHTLDSIQACIDTRSKELESLHNPSPNIEGEKAVAVAKEEGKVKAKAGEEASNNAPMDPRSEIKFICETMGSYALRKYVMAHLSEIDQLRNEVPAALRLAPNPSKLVLESMGRFYLQGSKAYDQRRDPLIVAGRHACILLLEFYILFGGCSSQVEPPIKEEARLAATAWRGRLVGEGGIELASDVDALGLVLFIASFGIPQEFRFRDLYDLLRASNLKKKADVLRLSPIFLKKLPDIIKDMIARDKHVEAVDLVCAFGLEEKFPPLSLLSSLCHKSMQIASEERTEGQCSVRSLKEANEREVALLKSVVNCLVDHRLDPSLLAGFSIFKKIAKLEKQISKWERTLLRRNSRRSAKEAGPFKTPETQTKRPWRASAEASHGARPHLIKHTQEQGSADSRHFYNGYLPQNMIDGGFTGSVDGGGMGLAAGNVLGPSPTAVQNLYQPPVSSLGSGSSGSNLYQFADTVLQHESRYYS